MQACGCYKHTSLWYFRASSSFWCVSTAVSTVNTNVISMCFRFYPLSKAFSNYLFLVNSVKIKLKLESVRSEMTLVLMHFAENAQLISVDGLNASKCTRFQTRQRPQGCISILIRLHGVSSKKFSKISIYWTSAFKAGGFVYRARRNEQTRCRFSPSLFTPWHNASSTHRRL